MLARWGTEARSPQLAAVFPELEPISSSDFMQALEEQDRIRSEMFGWLQSCDAVIAPVAAMPAPEHGSTLQRAHRTRFYTAPYNISGWPAAVVRCGSSAEGLPIGLQIIAHPWREDVALALAAALELDLGGWQPPPL